MSNCICGYDIGDPRITKHAPKCVEYQAIRVAMDEIVALHDNANNDEIDRDIGVSKVIDKFKSAVAENK